MNERDRKTSAEKNIDKHELEKAADKQHEKIRENIENKAERRGEVGRESIDESRDRAKELAHETKKDRHETDHTAAEKAEQAPEINPRAKRKEAYERTMIEMRGNLSPARRAFSSVIHNPVVEGVSEVAGKTVARPNAVLGGSMMAFFVVLIVFLVARHYGYPLSGSETIFAFAAGWVLGIVFDYLRIMITGRR